MSNKTDVLPAKVTERESAEEPARCFECSRFIAPPIELGLEVAEGVVLCADCCRARRADRGGMHERWAMPEWFDDLAGPTHHT
jgi:hypothetical protein